MVERLTVTRLINMGHFPEKAMAVLSRKLIISSNNSKATASRQRLTSPNRSSTVPGENLS
jgi:hypothetical protein